MKLEINVKRELFRFLDFQHWVDTARSQYPHCGVPSHRTIAVARNGLVVVSGAEFMAARDNDLFPVVVYELEREARA